MNIHSADSYDARLRQDFRLNISGGTFSSLECYFYVLDNADNLDWVESATILEECIRNTSKYGFFTVVPWVPGANKLKAEIKKEFDVASELAGSLCGYFDVGTDSIQRLIKMRRKFGGGRSGEWGLGGCLDHFTPTKQGSFAKKEAWNIFHVLSEPQKIGCYLFLGEMHQTTFLTKIFDGLDEYLSQIRGKKVAQ